jgi:chromosome segregation ATPase
MEQRIIALEKTIEKNSSQHGEFYKRICTLENSQTRTDVQYNEIMKKIDEMRTTLDELKNAPAKNWNTAISAIISGIVGTVIGFLLKGGL